MEVADRLSQLAGIGPLKAGEVPIPLFKSTGIPQVDDRNRERGFFDDVHCRRQLHQRFTSRRKIRARLDEAEKEQFPTDLSEANFVANFSIDRSKIIPPSLVLEITQAYRDLTGFYK